MLSWVLLVFAMPMIVKAFAYDACHVPKPLIYNCDINEKIGRKPAESHLTPTVPHVHNGRYEHEHRPFHVFITVDVR